MYEDLKYLIKGADINETAKLSINILIKAASWFPWLFIGIGLLLSSQYFIYWLGFFIFFEGLLLIALVTVLLKLVNSSIDSGEKPKEDTKLGSSIKNGIVGNSAFYLFILVALIIIKGMGKFDGLWQKLIS